jgi:acetyltransferase
MGEGTKMHIEYPNLEPLLQPKSIAIVGASEDITKPAGLPLYFALKHGFKGKIFPVNPNREIVQGLSCYPSILDIPDDLDAALIVVPAADVVGVLQQCAQKGVKAAVIPVSGFAELGREGRKRQDEIDEIVRISGIRICGPNTNGLLNVYGRVSLGYSYAQEIVTPGRLAYITQSGALLSASVPRLAQRGIGFSYLIAAGNQADLEIFDYARYIIDDHNTDVLALYVEGFKDPNKFLDIADLALEKGKPLLMIKAGRSEMAAKTAMSHTGSMVGSDAVFNAICKQKGVIRVDDFNILIATALAFLRCQLPRGNRVGIVSTSGGAISLIGDNALDLDLSFPDLSAKGKEEAAKIIPSYGEMKNPFDIGAAGAMATREMDLCRKAVELLVNDENIDIVLAAVTPIDPRGTQNFISAVVEASKTTDKPMILFCPMGQLREVEAEIFTRSNIPMLIDAAECVNAIQALVKFAEKTKKIKRLDKPSSPEIRVDVEEIKKSLKLGSKTLNEHESKKLLSRYGIIITEEAVAKSPGEAVRVANRIGYPVVLKIDSPGIIHKTDADAIQFNINNETELRRSYHKVIANSRKYGPKAEIRGVLVQEMVKEGREVIIGMSHDPQFGPVVMFGLGGVFVEVLNDISLRLIPITRNEAEEMIKEVKGYKILDAFRSRPKADIKSLIDTLLKVSRLAEDLGDIISDLDINPLVVFDEGKGVKVIDALIVLRG